MKFFEQIIAAVPQGKALFWIVVGAMTTFGAGFGTAFGIGDTADMIALVPMMKETQEDMVVRMDNFEVRLTSADGDREQILCLVRLTAAGEPLSPLEVQERCP